MLEQRVSTPLPGPIRLSAKPRGSSLLFLANLHLTLFLQQQQRPAGIAFATHPHSCNDVAGARSSVATSPRPAESQAAAVGETFGCYLPLLVRPQKSTTTPHATSSSVETSSHPLCLRQATAIYRDARRTTSEDLERFTAAVTRTLSSTSQIYVVHIPNAASIIDCHTKKPNTVPRDRTRKQACPRCSRSPPRLRSRRT